jgi:hypothetical protein
MTTFPLRLPDDLREQANLQAEAAGVSLNHYIAVAVASRVGAQAEADRYFAKRASRVTVGRAKKILAKAGRRTKLRPGDRLDQD